MAPRLPDFNLRANIWFNYAPVPNWTGDSPAHLPGTEADIQVDAQLYLPPKSLGPESLNSQNTSTVQVIGQPLYPLLQLRVPAGTDIMAPLPWPTGTVPGHTDYVEVPAGNEMFYIVVYVEDCHKGFENEYRVAFIRPFYFNGDRPRP